MAPPATFPGEAFRAPLLCSLSGAGGGPWPCGPAESGGGSRSPPDRGAALTPRQGAPFPWCSSAAHSPIVKMLAESRRVPGATAAGPRPALLPLSGQEA